jgi:hypothetical protein
MTLFFQTLVYECQSKGISASSLKHLRYLKRFLSSMTAFRTRYPGGGGSEHGETSPVMQQQQQHPPPPMLQQKARSVQLMQQHQPQSETHRGQYIVIIRGPCPLAS